MWSGWIAVTEGGRSAGLGRHCRSVTGRHRRESIKVWEPRPADDDNVDKESLITWNHIPSELNRKLSKPCLGDSFGTVNQAPTNQQHWHLDGLKVKDPNVVLVACPPTEMLVKVCFATATFDERTWGGGDEVSVVRIMGIQQLCRWLAVQTSHNLKLMTWINFGLAVCAMAVAAALGSLDSLSSEEKEMERRRTDAMGNINSSWGFTLNTWGDYPEQQS